MAFINIYAPNNRTKRIHEIKLTELKKKRDDSTIRVGDVNTLLSIMHKTAK